MSTPRRLREVRKRGSRKLQRSGLWKPSVQGVFDVMFKAFYFHSQNKTARVRHELTLLASSPFPDVMGLGLTYLLWYSDAALAYLSSAADFRDAVKKIIIPVSTLISIGCLSHFVVAESYQATLNLICFALHLGYEEAVFNAFPFRVKALAGLSARDQLIDLAHRLWQSAVGLFYTAGGGACRDDAFALTAYMLLIAHDGDESEDYIQHLKRLAGSISGDDLVVGDRFQQVCQDLASKKRGGRLHLDDLFGILSRVHGTPARCL